MFLYLSITFRRLMSVLDKLIEGIINILGTRPFVTLGENKFYSFFFLKQSCLINLLKLFEGKIQ